MLTPDVHDSPLDRKYPANKQNNMAHHDDQPCQIVAL